MNYIYSRAKVSVSSSSLFVFKEVLLEAALLVPALTTYATKTKPFVRCPKQICQLKFTTNEDPSTNLYLSVGN